MAAVDCRSIVVGPNSREREREKEKEEEKKNSTPTSPEKKKKKTLATISGKKKALISVSDKTGIVDFAKVGERRVSERREG